MGRIRILVVDGHRIFGEALATALSAEPDVDVTAVGTAAGAERALDHALREGRPFQVLLADAGLGVAPDAAPGDNQPSRGPAGTGAQLPPQRSVPPQHPLRTGGGRPRTGSAGPPHAAAAPVPVASPPTAPPAAPAAPDAPADGITLIVRLRVLQPELRAVVLADRDDPQLAVRALHAGAVGWVAKESSLGRLMAVVRGVLKDETHLPPALLTGVVRELTAARRDRSESERLVDTLTPREREVLHCMVAGMGRQAVAEQLFLSPHTVRTHMQNVLSKLDVHSTLAAVALARKAGVRPAET